MATKKNGKQRTGAEILAGLAPLDREALVLEVLDALKEETRVDLRGHIADRYEELSQRWGIPYLSLRLFTGSVDVEEIEEWLAIRKVA